MSSESAGRIPPVWKARLDDTAVAILCVHCGHQHSRALRWFRNHTKLVCDSCENAITLQNEQLYASIEELKHAMQGLVRSRGDPQATR
jgi:transcription elongation factor Elf1